MAGKNDAAANPKASATVAATKSGGLMPKYPASSTANKADNLAATNSPFSEISGLIILLIRSCETEEEITKSNPAAVDSAAAKAPAAKSAITQFGSWAISGFARTIISLSIVNSLIISLPLYWIMLSPFLSSNFNSPVSSHFLNQDGISV